MDPIVEPFSERVRQIRLCPPKIPFVSNVTGTWIRPQEAVDPEYWARQLRQTVRLGDGVRTLVDGDSRVLLEVGPGRVLRTSPGSRSGPISSCHCLARRIRRVRPRAC